MGILVVKSDFTGKYALALSITDKVDEYIQRYEEKLLIELLGKELFLLFKADVSAATRKPLTPIYQKLYEPLDVDYLHCGIVQSSVGMKNMLLGFIYFFYVRDMPVSVGMSGPTTAKVEASDPADLTYLYGRYNDSVETHNVILDYCQSSRTDYPTLKGRPKGIASWV